MKEKENKDGLKKQSDQSENDKPSTQSSDSGGDKSSTQSSDSGGDKPSAQSSDSGGDKSSAQSSDMLKKYGGFTPITGVPIKKEKKTFGERLKSRTFKMGTFATVMTAFIIIIAVVINVIITSLDSRYNLRFDMTANDFYGISEEIEQIVNGLQRDVKITVLAEKEAFRNINQYFYGIDDTLNIMSEMSGKITLAYIDVAKNPAFASSYPDQKLQTYDLLIESNNKVTEIDYMDLVNVEQTYYGSVVKSVKAEQVIGSAILSLTSDKQYRGMSTTGHSEVEATELFELLKSNNIPIEQTNLTLGEIPEDVNIILITSPMLDFTEVEIAKLDKFLASDTASDRTVLYFASANQPELPVLFAFLKEWGIEQEAGIVIEQDPARMLDASTPYVARIDYQEPELSQKYLDKNKVFIISAAAPFRQVYEKQSNMTSTVYLKFASTAASILYSALEENPDNPQRNEGEFACAIRTQKVRSVGESLIGSNVLAISGIDSFTGSMLTWSTIANAEYLLDMIDQSLHRETNIIIAEKQIDEPVAVIESMAADSLGITFIAILPVLIFAFGMVVWIKRRRK